jgi:hypothetical protein
MPFWPATDRERLADLFAAAETAARAASLPAGFDAVYDAGVSFDEPDASTDPAAPTLFGSWGWRGDANDVFKPGSAPSRELFVQLRLFCQRAHVTGNAAGYLGTAAAEFWRELQDATVTGLQSIVPQSLTYEQLPLFDPKWIEGRIEFKLMSDP